jgi:hypothetical protein
VLLLSNATPIDFEPLVMLSTERKPTVCVVLSAIAVADDRDAFHQHQWIDYRRREDHVIEVLARRLNEGASQFITEVLPDVSAPSATVLPYTALIVSAVLTVLSSGLMFAVLLRLLEIPTVGYQGPPMTAALAEAGSGFFALLTAAAIRGRLVTVWTYAVGMTGACAFLFATIVLQGGGFPVDVLIGAGVLMYSSASMRDWLPARRLPWRHPATLAPQPAWRFLARQALVSFVAALAVAVIWASSDGIRWR